MRISDWSSDVCSSDLGRYGVAALKQLALSKNPAVAEAARKALSRKNRYEPKVAGVDELAARITAYPAGRSGPRSLIAPAPPISASGGCFSLLPRCRSEERRGGKACVGTGRTRG